MTVIEPESRWYIDYTCQVCGQARTARFPGKDMAMDSEGDPIPKETIYCCECKSENLVYYDIEEY